MDILNTVVVKYRREKKFHTFSTFLIIFCSKISYDSLQENINLRGIYILERYAIIVSFWRNKILINNFVLFVAVIYSRDDKGSPSR